MISGLYIHGMKDWCSKSIFRAELNVYATCFVKEMKHIFLLYRIKHGNVTTNKMKYVTRKKIIDLTFGFWNVKV